MYDPESALEMVAGLPTTILLLGTPLAIISLTEVFGQLPPETLKRILGVLQVLQDACLQYMTLQKDIAEPANLLTCRYPPFGKEAVAKQEANGEWVMIRLGARFFKERVKSASQLSPFPKIKEYMSFQLMSTPSNPYETAYAANFCAQTVGLKLKVEGRSVSPNTPSINLIPFEEYICLMLVLICASVEPNCDPFPKQLVGVCQRTAESTGPQEYVQKPRQRQLQMLEGAQPGTPNDLANPLIVLQSLILLMQLNRMGQVREELLLVALVELPVEFVLVELVEFVFVEFPVEFVLVELVVELVEVELVEFPVVF